LEGALSVKEGVQPARIDVVHVDTALSQSRHESRARMMVT